MTTTTDTSSSWDTSMKWPQMTGMQKLSFVGKLLVSLVTFGFAFPNVMD